MSTTTQDYPTNEEVWAAERSEANTLVVARATAQTAANTALATELAKVLPADGTLGAAAPGARFGADPTNTGNIAAVKAVTDAVNAEAAKSAATATSIEAAFSTAMGAAFTADPTSAWTAGHGIAVGGFSAHWNGTKWVSGDKE